MNTGVPLLETKLYSPRWRSGLVSRPRLSQRLDQGTARKLTLVSAPAGFGKTTLLAEWLAATPIGERPAAWVSLDPGDNDPGLFWAYVITALGTMRSGVGENALSLLRSPQPQPIESVLTTLINEINAIENDFSLILDDFHTIDAEPVHDAVSFLLDHLPPQMHLVIASRTDPPLPLARLRARGDATELRAANLRFTPDEAAAFLNEVMGLNLSVADVAALEKRTEGWIAGLQLAALSMQGRDDIPGFIRAFAGDDRYILDYLVEEVLQLQSDGVRSFLLQTSLLNRLNGPLCDAVTGQDDGTKTLAALERSNLFVVPLDDKRRWYRYHHLFADVLQAHALEEHPDELPTLHQRASEWYEQNGLLADAVRHALAARDLTRAASLVELSALMMLGSNQEETLYGWIKLLPDELIRARPVLSVYTAFAIFGRLGLDVAEARLRDAEEWLAIVADRRARGEPPPPEMVVADEAGYRALEGTICIARAYAAGAVGDIAGTVNFARRALDVLPEDAHMWLGAGAALLGIASWTIGDLEAAHRSYSAGMVSLQKAGQGRMQICAIYTLADIEVSQGRLRQAENTFLHTLQIATAPAEPMWGTRDLYVGLADLARERDDLDAARNYLAKSNQAGEHAGLLETRHRRYVAMARLKEAEGDLDTALHLFAEAELQRVGGPDPDLHPIAALRAQIWIAQGKLSDAFAWARERNLTIDDDLSYVREFEHLTLARLLLAHFKRERHPRSLQDAIHLLDRLLPAADQGERPGSVIEILVLLALANEAQGDIPDALASLRRALTLAEPENYVRTFTAEGEPMRTLLREAAAGGVTPSYTRRLLAAFGKRDRLATPNIAEPLTTREIEILRLIAAGLRNQEIADRLFISLPTVKRHIANTYGKLDATHRTEAIARANELNLL